MIKHDHMIAVLEAYIPWNAQETKDLPLLLYHLKNTPDVLERKNTVCHFTASAWVVSKDRRYVLMAYHNIYNSWAWLGGHADGETDLSVTAKREAMEESGLDQIHLVSEEPLSIEILTVDGHEKKGEYVSSHLHLNVTYLLEADTEADLTCREDENSAVAWIPVDKIAERSSEPWFCERIYNKLCEKTAKLYPPEETVCRN